MDGSSWPFVFLIECAGIIEQEKPRNFLEITDNFEIYDDDKFIKISPSRDLVIDLEIDFNHQKINNLAPSPTLKTCDDHFTHWSQPRKLTFREWKRLDSFPDDYKAKTDKIGKYMIGMSVPPKMMYEVAKAVIEQWLT